MLKGPFFSVTVMDRSRRFVMIMKEEIAEIERIGGVEHGEDGRDRTAEL